MGQQTVDRTIRLNGQVGSGFTGMIAKVQSFAQAIEEIGGAAKQLLEDGLGVYQNYETNMLAAKYALSAQTKSVGELNKAMEELDKAASTWASTTIFHTDDVSKAINEAAHAGWNLEEILTGIPQAMLISQAGGLELSTGLDYLIKMVNATGSEFSDLDRIVDEWSMAANSSATTIGEMGEAFRSMGATAMFGDSTAELFTLLGTLANVGTVGTQAGTALRGAMVRLIAPTSKADDAMSLLGADVDELAEVLADESVTKAAKTLEGLGFSAYKSEGELKPLTQVFTELYEVTKDMDEASRNEIIAAIFPTRTIATAMALLEAASKNFDGLKEKITGSEGYAESGAEIMMSGLMGSTETLKSKWEEFQRKVGEFAAPEVEEFQGFLSGILDVMNQWPEEVWNGFVAGLETLAAGGAIAGAAKTVASLYGMLGPWGTLAVAAAFGTGALVGYLNQLNEVKWEEKFGQMDLDIESLNTYLDGVKTKWDVEKEALAEWDKAVTQTLENYQTASDKLSSMMLTDVITGKTLSDTDKKAIHTYFEEMYKAVEEGIEAARNLDEYGADQILEAAGEVPGYSETGNFLMQLLEGNYDSLYAQAESIGNKIREQMTAALKDNNLDEGERQAIEASISRLNEIEARIAAAQSEEEYLTILNKSQRVSWDSAEEFITDVAEQQNAQLAEIDDSYARKKAHFQRLLSDALKTGATWTDLDGVEHVVTQENYESLLSGMNAMVDRAWEATRKSTQDKFGGIAASVADALMGDSDFGEAWAYLKDLQANMGEDGSVNYATMGEHNIENVRKQIDELRKGGANNIRRMLSELLGSDAVNDVLGLLDLMNETDFDMHTRLSESAQEDMERADVSALQARLAKDREFLATEQRMYEEYVNAGNTAMASEYDRRIQNSMADIKMLEEEITALGGSVEETPLVAPIEAEIKSNEWEEYTPENKTAYIDVVTRESGSGNSTGNTSGTGSGGGGGGGINYLQLYAEGGRATTASVFGENGAEWAIPEEHSSRTADLLNAAREASGFTWGELLSRNGGLNGNAHSAGSVVIENYAPVIHASDASGVDAVLKADKERLKKIVQDAIAEGRMRDEIRVYA